MPHEFRLPGKTPAGRALGSVARDHTRPAESWPTTPTTRGDGCPESASVYGAEEWHRLASMGPRLRSRGKVLFSDFFTPASMASMGPRRTTFIPTEAGIHALVAIATDDQGDRTSNFRVVVVQHHPTDLNHDNVSNSDDIDLLVMQIAAGTNDPFFDLDGDEAVNLADRDYWLAEAGACKPGLWESVSRR